MPFDFLNLKLSGGDFVSVALFHCNLGIHIAAFGFVRHFNVVRFGGLAHQFALGFIVLLNLLNVLTLFNHHLHLLHLLLHLLHLLLALCQLHLNLRRNRAFLINL